MTLRARMPSTVLRALGLLALSHVAILALDPSKPVTQYIQSSWTTATGLPQSTVHAIVQTPDGYLWVATEQGLARFDGVRFTVFNQRGEALPSDNLRTLVAARDGSLWIGTDSGLTHMRAGTFRTYTRSDGLPDDSIISLTEARNGDLWIGTDKGAVRSQKGQFRVYTTADGLPHNQIRAIREDRDGVVWLATSGGLARFDGNQRFRSYTKRDGLPNNTVTALEATPDGAIWAGTYHGGLVRISGGRLSAPWKGLPPSDITCLRGDRDGNLWIGFEQRGIARLSHGRVSPYDVRQGLPASHVMDLFQDREGTLWIGMFTTGLVQLRDSRFSIFGQPEGLSNNTVWNVVESRDGSLWVGTDDAVHHLENGKVTVLPLRTGSAGASIHTLLEARDGTLWIGLSHGMLAKVRNGHTAIYHDPAAASAPINSLLEDREGVMWVGTHGFGLARFSDGRFEHYTRSGRVVALAQAPDGAIWAANDGKGLERLLDGSITTYTAKDGLPDNHVVSLKIGPEGWIWVGTTAGLSRMRQGKFTNWSVEQGLFSNTVGALLEDDLGNLWIACDQGLFRVSERELDEQAAGRRASVSSIVYGTADGLRSQECNYGTSSSAWKGRNGVLWFTTVEGLVAIDPKPLASNRNPPPVWVDSLRIDGRAEPVRSGLRIGPGTGRLEIDFTAPTFVSPKKVRFRYRLNGFDSDWIDAGERRTAYYTNLAPGKYTFQVQAANSDGVWSRPGASLRFDLRPQFYQTRLFLLFCATVAGLCGWGTYKLRMRYLLLRTRELEVRVAERTTDLSRRTCDLEEANRRLKLATAEAEEATRARTEFLATMSHEIRTPMNAVVGMAGLLAEMNLPDDARECADIVRSSGESLLTVINDILDFSKIESGKLEFEKFPFSVDGCVQQAMDVIAPKAAEKGLELTYRRGKHVPEGVVGDITRVRQILVNLLGNAVKFTASGEVEVSVRATQSEGGANLTFSVRDTGAGISPEKQKQLFQPFSQGDSSTTRRFGGTGLGLAICRRLCELMWGRIWVDSELGKGSTFHFAVPFETSATPDWNGSLLDRLRGRRVLIVDDNRTVRLTLASQLREWGLHMRVARSAAEAIGRIAWPELVILDAYLPENADLMQCLAARGTPAIALVAIGGRSVLAGGSLSSAGFLSKPVTPATLAQALSSVLFGESLARPDTGSRFDADLGTRLPLRILIAEDNPVNQKVALRLLEKLGYQAEFADNGRAVLDMLGRRSFDVVLMDVQMPEMDGIETTKVIRRSSAGPQPRIVAVTANAFADDREECLAAGMDYYISKPIRINELQAVLERCAAALSSDDVPV